MASDEFRTRTPKGIADLNSDSQNLVAIGVITSAHGIKGQVKLRSFTSKPQDIVTYGALLNKEGTKRFEIVLDGVTQNGLIATVKGVKDRNAAEALRNTELYVDRKSIPELDEEEFFYEQLTGMTVQDEAGLKLGKVTAVYDFGAGDIIEMLMVDTGKKEMFPFTKQNFPAVDIERGMITADLPEVLEVGGSRDD